MNQQPINVNDHQNIWTLWSLGGTESPFEGEALKQKGEVRKFPGCFGCAGAGIERQRLGFLLAGIIITGFCKYNEMNHDRKSS
jgi:hypothetical protein